MGLDIKEGFGAELNVYGFEVIAPVMNGEPDRTVFFLFGIGAVVILVLMALIFRKLNRVLRNAAASTPFQPENVRMLKAIGVLSMAIPVVGLLMSFVCRLVLGIGAAETSVNLYGFCVGLIVPCLTQFFAHGAALEADVDGLL